MTAAVVALNQAAKVALAACEQRIERGLRTFIDVGQALAEIRDSRLYKETHITFEEYCRDRWKMSDGRARQFMIAAATVTNVAVEGLPAPTNEGQARALAAVPEPERAEVWRETVERTNGKPTAAVVKQVAEDRAAPDEQVQRRCFGCRHIFTSGADNTCLKCGGFGIRYKTPEPVGAVTAPLAGSGIDDRPVESATPAAAPAEDPPAPEQSPAGFAAGGAGDNFTPPPGSPATWGPEQREANRLEVERINSIKRGRRSAEALVTEIRGQILDVIGAVDLGERGLVTAQMVADIRAAVDLLESRIGDAV